MDLDGTLHDEVIYISLTKSYISYVMISVFLCLLCNLPPINAICSCFYFLAIC